MDKLQEKAERALLSVVDNASYLAGANESARSIASRIYDDHRGLMSRLRQPWMIERITRLVERKLKHIQVGAIGGRASAAKLTPDERKEKARKAIQARWKDATPDERQANAMRANRARWNKEPKSEPKAAKKRTIG